MMRLFAKFAGTRQSNALYSNVDISPVASIAENKCPNVQYADSTSFASLGFSKPEKLQSTQRKKNQIKMDYIISYCYAVRDTIYV